jgi:hypothetical protein
VFDEGRGLQVPMVVEYNYIPDTYICFFRSPGLLDLTTLILEWKYNTHIVFVLRNLVVMTTLPLVSEDQTIRHVSPC